MRYFEDRAAVAEYVYAELASSKADLPWIMTIIPGKSGDFSAQIATDALSADTDETLVASRFFLTQVNT